MSNIAEKSDRKSANSKILLAFVPQFLQMQCGSTPTTNVVGVRPTTTSVAVEKCSKRATKRRRSGRIGKKQLFASCCMSPTPFVTKGKTDD